MIFLNRYKKYLPDSLKPLAKDIIRYTRMLFLSKLQHPDFIICGIRKGGTTSLYNYLIQHPNVLETLEKELNFFDHKFEKGIKWYNSSFKIKKNQFQIIGEASPQYQFHAEVPERIYKYFPKVKLIFILREPVSRAISDASFDIMHGAKNGRIDANIRFEKELEFFNNNKDLILNHYKENCYHICNNIPLINRGLYVNHLKLWYEVFPKDQILILLFDDLVKDPQAEVDKVCDFLNIKSFQLQDKSVFNKNEKKKATVNDISKSNLKAFYKPFNEELEIFLNKKLNW